MSDQQEEGRTMTTDPTATPTQGDESSLIGRRNLLRAGVVGGAAALAGAAAPSRAIAASGPPASDTSFPDFVLPKINNAEDSLLKIHKKGGILVGMADDWPYSVPDPNA